MGARGQQFTAWSALSRRFSSSAYTTTSVAATNAAASCWPASSSALRMASTTSASLGKRAMASDTSQTYIIFNAPCLFMHHVLCVLLHFVAFLCIFQN
jgi:hypothetical protein